MNKRKELDGLLDVAGKQAREILIELKGSLVPTWVMVDRDNRIEVVATPWGDELEKGYYKVGLRLLMRSKGVKVYSFITEAWTATVTPEEWDLENARPLDGKRPSEREDRQEIVIACACSRDLALWKRWGIVREPTTGHVVELVEKPMPSSDDKFESWLAQMLK